MDPIIRRLAEADAADFYALRLEALARHPEAFGTTPGEWQARGPAAAAAILAAAPPNAVLGVLGPGGLLGMAAVAAETLEKQRHRGFVWGVYLRPEARGTGLAARLMAAVEAAARAAGLEWLHLTVATGNAAAEALYRRAGYRPIGIEHCALKLGPGDYRDELRMERDLR